MKEYLKIVFFCVTTGIKYLQKIDNFKLIGKKKAWLVLGRA